MRREVYALVLPLIVVPAVLLTITIIGTILLQASYINKGISVVIALILTFAVIFGAMWVDTRGRKPSGGGTG